MTSRQPSNIVDCQGTITPHLTAQPVSGAEGFEGLVAAGGPPSATAPGGRLKHRTRKFTASGSLSDSSSSVKRQVQDTDVWITGFPKTGTTWISEIAWLIAHDLDYEGAKEEDYYRIRMMELTMLFDPEKYSLLPEDDPLEENSFKYSAEQESPRMIKSHLPFILLPDQIQNGTRKPRIIYTARNPMDTCVSYYHHCQNYESFTGTLDDFCKLFIFDTTNYGPYYKHVLSFWDHRSDPNILFLTYEEMQKDLGGVIDKVATFLGKTITEEDKLKLKDYVSFDSMKKNPAVNKKTVIETVTNRESRTLTPFIRKGKSGGYKSVMSPELIEQFRYWMKKRFEGIDLNLLDD